MHFCAADGRTMAVTQISPDESPCTQTVTLYVFDDSFDGFGTTKRTEVPLFCAKFTSLKNMCAYEDLEVSTLLEDLLRACMHACMCTCSVWSVAAALACVFIETSTRFLPMRTQQCLGMECT